MNLESELTQLQNDVMGLESYVKELEQQNTRLHEENLALEQDKERRNMSPRVVEILVKLRDSFKDLELEIGELR